MKKSIVLALCVFLFTLAYAQKLEWKAGMYHFFDNTEFQGSTFVNDQTMAGIRFMPEVGLRFGDVHRLDVGFDALKTYGSSDFLDAITPTAYYLYDDTHFRFQMGRFAKADQLDDFSRAFFQDSIRYFSPNMNGFMLSWKADNLRAKAFLDWTGKQDTSVHEAFFVGGTLRYQKNVFFAEMQALMFHYAGSLQQRGVRDNFLMHPAIGLDFKDHTWLQSLSLNLGWLQGIERNRNTSSAFSTRGGLLLEAEASYKGLELQSSSYWGQGLMIDYAGMGSDLYWGDPFYRGKSYHRIDASYHFLNTSVAKATLNLANHFSEGRYFVEQSLIVQIALHSNP